MTEGEQARLTAWRFRVLPEAANEHNVARVCRRFGISRKSFYKWKQRQAELGDAGRRACAAPVPVLRMQDQAGSNRVVEDVPADGSQVDVVVHELRPDAPLRQIAATGVAMIPPPRVNAAEAGNRSGDVGIVRPADEMVVIGHRAIGVPHDRETCCHLGEQFQESRVVLGIEKQQGLRVAASHDVIARAGEAHSKRPGHEAGHGNKSAAEAAANSRRLLHFPLACQWMLQ